MKKNYLLREYERAQDRMNEALQRWQKIRTAENENDYDQAKDEFLQIKHELEAEEKGQTK